MKRQIPPGRRFSILDRVFKARISGRAKEYGLTPVQLRVLGCLSRLESYNIGEINQKDLEMEEHLTHQTMTEIIKKLSAKGYIECSISQKDRRYKKICCKQPYKEIYLQIAEEDQRVMQEICKGLSQEEIAALLTITDKILRNIGYDPDKFIGNL